MLSPVKKVGIIVRSVPDFSAVYDLSVLKQYNFKRKDEEIKQTMVLLGKNLNLPICIFFIFSQARAANDKLIRKRQKKKKPERKIMSNRPKSCWKSQMKTWY